MEETREIAYLREFPGSNQCELMFELKINFGGIGTIHENVKALRQATDTVESMLQHIINKVHHLIKKQLLDTEENNKEMPEIKVSLRSKTTNKHIAPKKLLKNLVMTHTRDLQFSIGSQNFDVLINAPLVKELKLPVVLYSNFPVQPSRIHILFCVKNSKSKFFWYKSEDKQKWDIIGNVFKYKVKDEDVGFYLKLVCVPCNDHLQAPQDEVISENKVEKMEELPTCPFEERQKFTTEKLQSKSLRVVSYNVLASRYAETNEHFPYCTPKALSIDYRKQLVGKEITGYQADIICLQEVDSSAYTSYYKDLFNKEGYSSYYHRKGNRIPEGLACVFNKIRFKKVDDHQLVFCNEVQKNKLFSYMWNLIKSNEEVKSCILKQQTSLHVTVLKERSKENSYIIVANTHLYYHPDAEHIRILQANMATTYINFLRKKYSKNGQNASVIFCGDFNCTPASSVFSYMIKGNIDSAHEVTKKISNKVNLNHNFVFESACGKPKYTNYTGDFKDCLDYIFIEKTKMKVNSFVPFPKEEDLEAYEGLPNEFYPSDHLALIVDLEFV